MSHTVLMHFGDTTISGELNDTDTAKAFAERLPLMITVNGTGIDFCGRMPGILPYEPSQVHNGWQNGDINYNPEGVYHGYLQGYFGVEDLGVYEGTMSECKSSSMAQQLRDLAFSL